MHDTTHDELKSLLAAYALGSVSEEEERALRAHLMTCEECLAEVDSYAGVTSQLALAVEPEELPVGFADRVLAQAGISAEVPTRARRGPAWRWVAALGAAAVLLMGGLTVALIDARADLEEQTDVAAALLRGQGMRLEGGEAVAAMVPSDDGAVFVVNGLPAASRGKTYQLWLLGEDRPVSAGTFDVSDGGALFETDRSIEGFSGAAVTIEPVGGSQQPTTDPILTSL